VLYGSRAAGFSDFTANAERLPDFDLTYLLDLPTDDEGAAKARVLTNIKDLCEALDTKFQQLHEDPEQLMSLLGSCRTSDTSHKTDGAGGGQEHTPAASSASLSTSTSSTSKTKSSARGNSYPFHERIETQDFGPVYLLHRFVVKELVTQGARVPVLKLEEVTSVVCFAPSRQVNIGDEDIDKA
ncbi:unnamed protein product, partial [Amoebophrya sp. A25]